MLEDLPDVDTVLVPFGGGGLSCGIAAGLAALRPEARVFGCEVETAAPLAPSLAAGSPQTVDYTPSFVDGIGSRSLLPEMWPLVSTLLAGSRVVSLEQAAGAVRLLAERHRVIAEGAGGASVAAALAGVPGARKVVCIVSGGNLDAAKLSAILEGRLRWTSWHLTLGSDPITARYGVRPQNVSHTEGARVARRVGGCACFARLSSEIKL